MQFEYTVIPAPTRTKRTKGKTTPAERLALAMEDSINEMASEGWEYWRTETLTVEDKPGRFSKIVERIETVLVFRKALYVEETRVESTAASAAPAPEPEKIKKIPEPKVSEAAQTAPKNDSPIPAARTADSAQPQPLTRAPQSENNAPPLGGVEKD